MKKQLIHAKTVNQKEYVRSIFENDITICAGPAGTGKTLMALHTGYNQMEQNAIGSMLITRSIQSCGRTFPPVPGGVREKFDPYVIPYIEYLTKICGAQEFKKFIASDKIMIRPVEIIRGHTYDNCFMILEEAQNCTPEQLKLFITRAGTDAKIIIIGDPKQKDINHYSALDFAMDHLYDASGCRLIEMDYTDVQRNKRLAHIIKIFDDKNI